MSRSQLIKLVKASTVRVLGAVSGLTGQLDKMTGGAVTGFRNMVGGLKGGVAGLKSFKVALAATGIGLLLVAIGSLVSFFHKHKERSGATQSRNASTWSRVRCYPG